MQLKGAENMQVVQPEIKKLNDKYKNKTSPADKKKKQEETMAIYSRYKINPLASC